jgi:hypothetical protein
MNQMTIKLDSLPLNIYKKIPINIKTYKKEYELSELPYDIQKLVNEYEGEKSIKYAKVYDFDPVVSEYGDLNTVSNLRELVLKYVKSYLYTLKGEYPFNGSIGSRIKTFIQKRDTTIQRLYLSEELQNMVTIFGTSVKSNIKIIDFKIHKNTSSQASEYNLSLSLSIDDVSTNIIADFVV